MTGLDSSSPGRSSAELVSPGKGNGLADVFRSRFLLQLLVRKELRIRYRGSVLGLLWTYVKPGVQFIAFYIALGVFLGLEQSPSNRNGLPNYAVYLFSGIVLVNFFTEALSTATRSIVNNSGLINKIYLPRELFPAASVWVSAVHFFPQVLVLAVAALFTGWHPGPLEAVTAVAGFVMIALLATGLGLFFSAVNVYFRDSENFVDMLLMVATWVSPVLYSWQMVQGKAGAVGFALYQLNPITIAVECFHHAFWLPTTEAGQASPPHLLALWVPVGLGVSLLVLILGQWTFRRLEGRFAQEL